MVDTASIHTLNPRDRDILRDVIYTYIAQGEPVSSRTMARQEKSGLSAATIRNVMADLEELGFLHQPHTSAGRVPTATGYHAYIDTLMEQKRVSTKQKRFISDHLRRAGDDGEERMNATSQLLSKLSQQVGLVLIPALGETVLKAIDFVPLTGSKVLCVVVSSTGFVDSKVVALEAEVTPEELIRAANYLNENFAGLSIRQIRDRLLKLMDDERNQVNRLLGLVITLAGRSLGQSDVPEVLVDGAAGLLSQPELSDLRRVRRLFDAFDEKVRLVQLLNQCLEGQGVRTWIAEDSALTSELDFSLIATNYSVGGRVLGSLGIMGPSRMEYEKVIPLVEYLANSLSDALADTFEA
ncbi:MAG: heat-inducible transcriptional repressor HrcA [Thermoanaerobaculia bacterium]|nr:heat-inducible transcriptional repressor HrcA [Thermoanaerobaculia bacterium]